MAPEAFPLPKVTLKEIKQASDQILGTNGRGIDKFGSVREAAKALKDRAEQIIEEQRKTTT